MIRIDKELVLLKLEISRLINTNSRNRKILSSIAFNILIGAIFLAYSVIFTLIYVEKNEKYLCTAACAITFLIILINNIVFSNNSLFSRIEMDMIFPLPLSELEIISSKIIGIYAYNLFYIATILAFPIIYISLKNTNFFFALFSLLILLVFPLIPLALSLLITITLGKLLKNRNIKLFLTVLAGGLGAGIYYFSIISRDSFRSKFGELIIEISKLSVFKFFNEMILNGVYIRGIIFILISIVVFGLISIYISKNYFNIYYRKTNKDQVNIKKKTRFQVKRKATALLGKDISLYLSYPSYVANTIFGPLLLLFFGLGPMFVNISKLNAIAGFDFENFITNNLILVICGFAAIGQTTYCSLSIEGKTYYLMQTLPLKKRDVIFGKVKFSMLLMILPILISALILGGKCNLKFVEMVLLILNGFSYNLFANLLGINFDIFSLEIDWINPQEVVKQRFSMLVIQLIMIFMVGLCFFITNIVFYKNRLLSWLIIFVLVNIINLLQIHYLKKGDLRI